MEKKYFFPVGLVLILGLFGYSLVRLFLKEAGKQNRGRESR